MSDFFNRNGTLSQMADVFGNLRQRSGGQTSGWFDRFGSIISKVVQYFM